MSRSCNELGVCQCRKPACQGCSWKLAPGVIDGPYRRRFLSAKRVAALGRALLFVAAVAALVATLGFAAGYFNLGGLLS